MRSDDRAESRRIARWWEDFTIDKDVPKEAAQTMEGAAGFAQAHALLAVADGLHEIASAIREHTRAAGGQP